LTQANAARLAFHRRQLSASITSAREEGDFPLPKLVNGAILAPKSTESGECRLISWDAGGLCQQVDHQPIITTGDAQHRGNRLGIG
jgi:hypothetical protein